MGAPYDYSKAPAPDLWGSQMLNVRSCAACASKGRAEGSSTSQSTSLVMELQLPMGASGAAAQPTFDTLLRNSINRTTTSRGFCKVCKEYRGITQTRRITKLPNVLALNCNPDDERMGALWAAKTAVPKPAASGGKGAAPVPRAASPEARGWRSGRSSGQHEAGTEAPEDAAAEPAIPGYIPHQLRLRIDADGELHVGSALLTEGEGELPVDEEGGAEDADEVVYDLMAAVAHIRDSGSGGTLVATIRVGPQYHKLKEGITTSGWYAFNDFAVSPIDATAATVFDSRWKVPVILYYTCRGLEEKYRIEPQPWQPLRSLEERFLTVKSLATQPFRGGLSFRKIGKVVDIPGKGDLVALDAEFVSIAKEEAEIRSDGFKSTIKPAHMACARVSLVHGSGPHSGEAFVDDFIKNSEEVVDYLTRWSGIQPGDLDPATSKRHLTTLKDTCLKIRLLELRGVIFVGHGLSKDFRVINMSPPPAQVIDTVDIYRLPGQRKLSLRFLAWVVLGVFMQQSAAGHDSIEDSRVSLQLYKRHRALKDDPEAGKWEYVRKGIYDEGYRRKFAAPAPPEAPPDLVKGFEPRIEEAKGGRALRITAPPGKA